MKKIIIVSNDLSNSGNSIISRLISIYLENKKFNSLLITSDYSDYTKSFNGDFWDLEDEFNISELENKLLDNDCLILDVSTGSSRNLSDFYENKQLDNLLIDYDVETTIVIPNTFTERCNEEIVDIINLYDDSLDFVIAHFSTNKKDEIKWHGSPAEKAVRYLKHKEIHIPEIPQNVNSILKSIDSSLIETLNDYHQLSRVSKPILKNWINKIDESFNSIDSFLHPEFSQEIILN